MSANNQAGKGRGPEKGYNHKAFRDGWDRIFAKKRLICDICGRPISDDDLKSGAAIRKNDVSNDRESYQSYETYHIECREYQDIKNEVNQAMLDANGLGADEDKP